MQNAETIKTKWLPLLRASGDADLGAGLVRLATLAAAVHQHEAAMAAARGAGAETSNRPSVASTSAMEAGR